MKKFLSVFALMLSHVAGAHATALISDVRYTAHSLTFTATGDLHAYAPAGTDSEISIVYSGDLYNNADYQLNQYKGDLFANAHAIEGATGGFGFGYNFTWIGLDKGNDLTFSGDQFTISWDSAMINTAGTGVVLVYFRQSLR